jgi:hypothetical protein
MESPNAAGVGSSGKLAPTDGGVATPVDGGATPSPGTISNAARVVAGMRSRFRACYQALLDERNRNAVGQVRLSIRVDCEGRIEAMTARVSGVDKETVECMFAAVGDDHFDPPAGGKAVVNVPVNFAQSSQKDSDATSARDAG